MIFRARFSSAAEQDILAAQEWYAQQRPGLDLSFRDELDRVVSQMRAYPSSFPVVHEKTRRANLHRFPYSVFYVVRSKDVFVLGVVHQARDPNLWKRR